MADYTLREVQKQIDDWVQEVGKGYWSPHEMLARLVEEVGETSRLINHLYGQKKKKGSEPVQELSGELADILFAVICLANSQDINLQEAFEQMMSKYTIRDKERY
ncbi:MULTISPECIES: nucleotide pyrophosphohydrolase [unclassified Nodularia (in: cyanobacteria)]|uniref:nucleotide pyrophosphohydrolase n=1 Tax=unclassified Nodularia (in: cyanobacteria) TaxID=2656917 RepID=UPI001880187D|nr:MULTISPECIES: nucleotide pyrophosphohydrolase [unclassified Nodularia (in: cyanobacteria)]MBE9200058.1 nucleotide pyrophosphohydrolase [Nodularia sp. LEGE 06071]MCC2691962.1 nucleotide pyrophosphohydrolase [Nodularia sp. LEGE 04288]